MQHATQFISTYPKRFVGATMALVLTVGLCPLPSTPVAYADTAAEKQAEAEQALANLNAMQESLDRLSAEYGEALMAQEEAEDSRDAAQVRIGEINQQIDSLQDRLGERARDMYRSGNVSYVEILLGARTFEEFATSWDMLNKMNANDASLVEEQRSLRLESEQQAQVFNEQARLASQKSDEAAAAAQQAQATVAEMQATYDSLSAEAARLLEEERAAQEAAEAARAAAIVAESARAAAAAEAEAQAAAAAQADNENASSEKPAKSSSSRSSASSATTADSADGSTDDSVDDASDDVTDGTSDDTSDDTESDGSSSSAASATDEGDEQESDSADAAETDDEETDDETADEEESTAYEGGSDTVSRAYACLGAPYVWGGVGPEGYDCSGLVSYCLTGSHTRLGTTLTFMEWPQVTDPQPGDICVNSGHTGVYIGDGQMIHAATYGVGVIVGPVQSGMIIVRYAG